MTRGAIALRLCASLGAILAALAAWMAGEELVAALGLETLRPLVLVVVLFLSLTAVQAFWDRVESILQASSRRGHL